MTCVFSWYSGFHGYTTTHKSSIRINASDYCNFFKFVKEINCRTKYKENYITHISSFTEVIFTPTKMKVIRSLVTVFIPASLFTKINQILT